MQKKAQQQINAAEPSDSFNSNIIETLRTKLLAGNKIRAIDYSETNRAEVLGAIATLQDELPIKVGWQTIRQSYLSETRTLARSYHIPEAFLREVTA